MNVGHFYHKFLIEHYFEYHCIIFWGFHNGKKMRKRLCKLGLHIMKGIKMELCAYDTSWIMYNITNLTSNDLVMDQSCKVHLFIGSYVLCTNYHALEIRIDTQINVLIDEIWMNKQMNFAWFPILRHWMLILWWMELISVWMLVHISFCVQNPTFDYMSMPYNIIYEIHI